MANVTGSSKKESSVKATIENGLLRAMVENTFNKKSTNTASQPVAKKSEWSWWQILLVIFVIAFVHFLLYSYNSVPSQPTGFISSYI